MTLIAGVDVGNATTEVVLVDGKTIVGAGRAPTRGRKGSADSLRGAAALLRRVERRAGRTADEARIAPLRAVDTSIATVPDVPASNGRLRVLAAGVPTPGGTGAFVGTPLLVTQQPMTPGPFVAVVPPGLRYDQAAARLRALQAAGTKIGAVLVPGDEGVLVANRLPAALPVIDQVDAATAASSELLAVEVQPMGHSLRLLGDPVALAAALGLGEREAGEAARICRGLADHSNAVVGLLPPRPADTTADTPTDEPWVQTSDGRRLALRAACPVIADGAVGMVRLLGTASGTAEVDDLFAVDLAAAAEAATARQGTTGRAVLVASLGRLPAADPPDELLGLPVHRLISEPAAARAGALTTPGARSGALVVDLGAGTVDVIGPADAVVAAGAGDLLTAAVAETLGIPRAAADWVKRGPCIRVDGGRRFEAEDGTHGFLAAPAPASSAGMLAVDGPGGLLPFDRRHGPAEWRAIRLRLKIAILAANLRRAIRTLGTDLGTDLDTGLGADLCPGRGQVLVVGGPAGDEELLGVIMRSLPGDVAVGRGNVGGTLDGEPLGHRYAVALGLALAGL